VPRKPFEIFVELPGVIIQPKKRSGLFLRDFVVKRVLVHCAVRKASIRTWITIGVRSFSKSARNA
jgi:hypothetical protein